jgi:hypothetical protein
MRQSIIDRDGWNGTTCHAACTWSHTLDCGHSFLWRYLSTPVRICVAGPVDHTMS